MDRQDRRALILGDRYQSFYFPEVARACASGLDAASGNLNAPWNDGSLPRFYLPVIGADWFQYYDEPTHGRADGEDFDFGLVDIHNRPYAELVAAASNLNVQALHR